MSADPITLAIGGAAIGGMLDKKNPLRGAALGGLGGYFGGPLLQGLGGATGAAGGAAGGSGLAMNAAGAGLQAASAPMAQGMGAQGLMMPGSNVAAASMPQMAAGASSIPGGLSANAISPAAPSMFGAKDMLQMGGKMAMQGQGQEQRPAMAAPPMPIQQGQPQSFASISPYAGLLSQRRIPVI